MSSSTVMRATVGENGRFSCHPPATPRPCHPSHPGYMWRGRWALRAMAALQLFRVLKGDDTVSTAVVYPIFWDVGNMDNCLEEHRRAGPCHSDPLLLTPG